MGLSLFIGITLLWINPGAIIFKPSKKVGMEKTDGVHGLKINF
jgi:hypothetical protein